jgi:hypothetical protein
MGFDLQRFVLQCLKGAVICAVVGTVATAAIWCFESAQRTDNPIWYAQFRILALVRVVLLAAGVGAIAGAANELQGDDLPILRSLIWVGGFTAVGAFLGAVNLPPHGAINPGYSLAGALIGAALFVLKRKSRRDDSAGH